MTATQSLCLKLASVLWIIWGLARVFAGVEVMTFDTAGGLETFGDTISAELLAMMEEHAAVGGMLSWDGWNLGLSGLAGGAATQVKHCRAEFSEATGGSTAESMCFQGGIGYFFFVGLGEYANFIPTVMIFILGAAIVLSCRGLF